MERRCCYRGLVSCRSAPRLRGDRLVKAATGAGQEVQVPCSTWMARTAIPAYRDRYDVQGVRVSREGRKPGVTIRVHRAKCSRITFRSYCMNFLKMSKNSSLPPAVSLMGPTATGKTELALALVQHFPFEIVSVDSAMVYRGMDIGTAKPSQAVLRAAPHRLIDILDPVERYSAGRFRDG